MWRLNKLLLKRSGFIIGVAIFYIIFQAPYTFSQSGKTQNITLVVPESGVSNLIKGLFPYPIDFGKGFSGSFWIKSIDSIKIKKDRVSFATYIYGKDITYSTKIVNQAVRVEVGNINLHNNWKTSLRYDKKEKILLIKPHIEEQNKNKDSPSQGDMLLNALLMGLSDLEFPIEMKDLKPMTTVINNTKISINMEILDIYAGDGSLFIEVKPTAEREK